MYLRFLTTILVEILLNLLPFVALIFLYQAYHSHHLDL